MSTSNNRNTTAVGEDRYFQPFVFIRIKITPTSAPILLGFLFLLLLAAVVLLFYNPYLLLKIVGFVVLFSLTHDIIYIIYKAIKLYLTR